MGTIHEFGWIPAQVVSILTTMADRDRYERLVRPHLDGLYRFACQLERDPVRAEDLVQKALIVGLRKLHQLRDSVVA